jgi:hypothetical protein
VPVPVAATEKVVVPFAQAVRGKGCCEKDTTGVAAEPIAAVNNMEMRRTVWVIVCGVRL